MVQALLFSVFVIATCGLVYELLAGTIASYLLGDSVTQFSTIIGVYLFAMGVGSYLSRFVTRRLILRFVQIEILVGLVGGFSSLVLFIAFAEVNAFRFVLYSWVFLTGVLVGMEIPLLMRILKDQLHFSDLVSKVLSLDYLGALAAALLFPLWLVPKVGLMRSAFVFGVLNMLVAVWACHLLAQHIGPGRKFLTFQAWASLFLLLGGVVASDNLMKLAEERLYTDPVILARSSPYQRIILTRSGKELRLYLNGHLQFSTFDEYRYHEALVHPGLAAVPNPRRVLVLGGGDGMAVREILRDERVEEVTLVDLDPAMVELFRDRDDLAALNDFALRSDKVTVENADAFIWLDKNRGVYDFIVVDFPDPSNYSLGKLYSVTFYRRLKAHLAPDGMIGIQSTSPLFARRAFWSIVSTLRASGFEATPLHAYVPSFGEWGFVVASLRPYAVPEKYPTGLRFLAPEVVPTLFYFPADMAPVEAEANHLNDQVLVRYYEDEWRRLPG
jgi:spermidine synthase